MKTPAGVFFTYWRNNLGNIEYMKNAKLIKSTNDKVIGG